MSGFYRIIIIKLVLRYLIIWKGFITLSPFGSSELIPLSFFLLKVSSELIFARHIVVQYLIPCTEENSDVVWDRTRLDFAGGCQNG